VDGWSAPPSALQTIPLFVCCFQRRHHAASTQRFEIPLSVKIVAIYLGFLSPGRKRVLQDIVKVVQLRPEAADFAASWVAFGGESGRPSRSAPNEAFESNRDRAT
jgi:hypothetical protein